MANKKFSEFELKTTTSNVSHIVGYNGAENVRITPANFLDTTGGPYLPLAGGTMAGTIVQNGGNIDFADGRSANFGDGDDLQIYHDGSSSYIKDVGTGDLRIWADNPNISTLSGNKYFYGNNGSAELYHSGNKKLGTSSTGISVTGNGVFSGDVKIGVVTATAKLNVDSDNEGDFYFQGGTGNARQLKFSTFATVSPHAGHKIDATSGNGVLAFATGSTERMRIASDGKLTVSAGSNIASFQSVGSGSNLRKFDISTGGDRVVINAALLTNAATDLAIETGGTERMRLDTLGNLGLGVSNPSAYVSVSAQNIVLGNTSSSNGLTVLSGTGSFGNLAFADGTSVDAQYKGLIQYGHTENSMKFFTNNLVRMTIDSSGNVGIGTSSPSNTLTLGSNDSVHTDLEVRFSSVPIYVSGGYNGTATTNQLSSNFKDTSTSSGGETYTNLDNDSFGGLAYRQSSINSPTGSFHSWSYAAPTAGTPSVVELMRLNSSGNLGIGVTPSSKLDVLVGNDERLLFTNVNAKPIISAVNAANGSYKTLQLQGSDLYFMISGTEKMRLTSSGALQVGGTDTGYSSTLIQTGSFSSSQSGINILTNSTGYAYMLFGKGSGSDLYRGQIAYKQGDDFMAFQTAGTEKMRITDSGVLGIGTTGLFSFGSGSQSGAFIQQSSYMGISIASGQTAALILRRLEDGTLQRFYNSNSVVGSISVAGSATAYNTSSDYRLKEDLQDFKGLDLVSKIPVYDYKWKADESRSYGVLAHQLQEVLPQAVTGEKDAEEMQSVDYSKIVPLLVKSIQELTAKVEKLELNK